VRDRGERGGTLASIGVQVLVVSRPDPSFLVVSRDERAIETDPYPASMTTLGVPLPVRETRELEKGSESQDDSSIRVHETWARPNQSKRGRVLDIYETSVLFMIDVR